MRPAPDLHLAVVTDVHLGPDAGDRLGTKAPSALEAFVKAVNYPKNRPQAVI